MLQLKQPSAAAAPTRKPIRWWPAAVIVTLQTMLVVIVRSLPDFDNGLRNMILLASSLFTCFNLLVWFIFFSRADRKFRRMAAAAAVSFAICVPMVFRVESVSGDIVPKLTWRWGQKRDAALVTSGDLKPVAVNLARTTPQDFPQFLGPDRNGRLTGVGLARDWQTQPPKLLWKQPIGVGWSSFAIVGDYAVTQEQRGEQELVVCYELLTGKMCWQHDLHTERFNSVMGGDGPRATPTISDGRVYATGARGNLVCLDGATGQPLWSHDIVTETKARLPDWGKSNSPLVLNDLVIVSAGGPSGRSLQAFDKATGALVWEGGDAASSYASPMVATLDGVPQILSVNEETVTGHDTSTGAVLWSFPWSGREPKVPQPVPVADNRVLICAGYGIGSKVLEVKAGEPWEVKEVWGNSLLKPKFANVVLRDGFVYGFDDGRTLICLDVATGKRKWNSGRSGYGHGQLLLVDDLLLIQAESGEVALAEASPEKFKELTRFTALAEKTWNCATLSGRRLLVRNAQEAACYELPIRK